MWHSLAAQHVLLAIRTFRTGICARRNIIHIERKEVISTDVSTTTQRDNNRVRQSISMKSLIHRIELTSQLSEIDKISDPVWTYVKC